MAEAHQAVGLTFEVTHDGSLKFNYDRELINLIWQSAQRSYKKRLARLINNIRTGIFPFGPYVILGSVAVFTSVQLAGLDLTYGLLHWLNPSGLLFVLSCFLSAILLCLLLISAVRLFLRLLFSYQGWIYLEREDLRKPPLHIKLWFGLVHLLTSLRLIGFESKPGKPMLFSYQGALPSLPLPTIKGTLDRHLASVRAIYDDREYNEMVELTREFETGIGPKLQRFLWLKWWWSDNYVSDWWEEYVYLRGRSPIMINSNYYVLDTLQKPLTSKQSARAAMCIHAAFCFRRIVLKQETTPLFINNMVPLCSRQYDRIFNTTRIPGESGDTLLHMSDSTHVVVLHKGRFFRIGCYHKGKLLTPREIQSCIEGILTDTTNPDPGEADLSAMTGADRTLWAQTRKKYFSSSTNRSSIEVVDKAAFVVVLDDYDLDLPTTQTLTEYGKMMLHGDGNNRWFDKSFTIIVNKNASVGANVEHSWADAPVFGHLWEYVLCYDRYIGYDDEGNCKMETEPESSSKVRPSAVKLRWNFPEEVRKVFTQSLESAKILINDLDLKILSFEHFGKGGIKKCKLSPDAFVQMALQLAYRRDAGRFCLTYESCMTRLYKEGRTETVRPCTIEAAAWVMAMDDGSVTKLQKLELLKKACAKHQMMIKDAMTGKGVDRHLFCLYVVSRYLEIDSPFLKKVLGEPWRLSTSQTAIRGEYLDLKKNPEMVSASGGFGPVTDDGYGVAYSMLGEDIMFFHISSKQSSAQTDSNRFSENISKALLDVRALFE